MLSYAVGRSGGLTYHYSAWRNARTRWQPFRERVRSFLETWNPSEKELVIFGPSAGWTLPSEWLARFGKIVAVEPDPVARWLFARRFPLRNLEFESSPRKLPWFAAADEYDRALADFLALHPTAAVLFSNVLGQLGGLVTLDDTFKGKCLLSFVESLEGRTWASFHDVLSSRSEFKKPWPSAPSEIGTSALARVYFENPREVVDHETVWLSELSDRKSEFGAWELRPGENHLIGFVSPK